MNTKTIRRMAQLGAAIILTATGAFAQLDAKIIVDVPFDFQVNQQSFQAGTYTILRSHMNNVLRIERDGVGRMFANTMNKNLREDARPHLVFARYGDTYFLRQAVGIAGGATELLPSAHEKELTAKRITPEMAVIQARSRRVE